MGLVIALHFDVLIYIRFLVGYRADSGLYVEYMIGQRLRIVTFQIEYYYHM